MQEVASAAQATSETLGLPKHVLEGPLERVVLPYTAKKTLNRLKAEADSGDTEKLEALEAALVALRKAGEVMQQVVQSGEGALRTAWVAYTDTLCSTLPQWILNLLVDSECYSSPAIEEGLFDKKVLAYQPEEVLLARHLKASAPCLEGAELGQWVDALGRQLSAAAESSHCEKLARAMAASPDRLLAAAHLPKRGCADTKTLLRTHSVQSGNLMMQNVKKHREELSRPSSQTMTNAAKGLSAVEEMRHALTGVAPSRSLKDTGRETYKNVADCLEGHVDMDAGEAEQRLERRLRFDWDATMRKRYSSDKETAQKVEKMIESGKAVEKALATPSARYLLQSCCSASCVITEGPGQFCYEAYYDRFAIGVQLVAGELTVSKSDSLVSEERVVQSGFGPVSGCPAGVQLFTLVAPGALGGCEPMHLAPHCASRNGFCLPLFPLSPELQTWKRPARSIGVGMVSGRQSVPADGGTSGDTVPIFGGFTFDQSARFFSLDSPGAHDDDPLRRPPYMWAAREGLVLVGPDPSALVRQLRNVVEICGLRRHVVDWTMFDWTMRPHAFGSPRMPSGKLVTCPSVERVAFCAVDVIGAHSSGTEADSPLTHSLMRKVGMHALRFLDMAINSGLDPEDPNKKAARLLDSDDKLRDDMLRSVQKDEAPSSYESHIYLSRTTVDRARQTPTSVEPYSECVAQILSVVSRLVNLSGYVMSFEIQSQEDVQLFEVKLLSSPNRSSHFHFCRCRKNDGPWEQVFNIQASQVRFDALCNILEERAGKEGSGITRITLGARIITGDEEDSRPTRTQTLIDMTLESDPRAASSSLNLASKLAARILRSICRSHCWNKLLAPAWAKIGTSKTSRTDATNHMLRAMVISQLPCELIYKEIQELMHWAYNKTEKGESAAASSGTDNPAPAQAPAVVVPGPMQLHRASRASATEAASAPVAAAPSQVPPAAHLMVWRSTTQPGSSAVQHVGSPASPPAAVREDDRAVVQALHKVYNATCLMESAPKILAAGPESSPDPQQARQNARSEVMLKAQDDFDKFKSQFDSRPPPKHDLVETVMAKLVYPKFKRVLERADLAERQTKMLRQKLSDKDAARSADAAKITAMGQERMQCAAAIQALAGGEGGVESAALQTLQQQQLSEKAECADKKLEEERAKWNQTLEEQRAKCSEAVASEVRLKIELTGEKTAHEATSKQLRLLHNRFGPMETALDNAQATNTTLKRERDDLQERAEERAAKISRLERSVDEAPYGLFQWAAFGVGNTHEELKAAILEKKAVVSSEAEELKKTMDRLIKQVTGLTALVEDGGDEFAQLLAKKEAEVAAAQKKWKVLREFEAATTMWLSKIDQRHAAAQQDS